MPNNNDPKIIKKLISFTQTRALKLLIKYNILNFFIYINNKN